MINISEPYVDYLARKYAPNAEQSSAAYCNTKSTVPYTPPPVDERISMSSTSTNPNESKSVSAIPKDELVDILMEQIREKDATINKLIDTIHMLTSRHSGSEYGSEIVSSQNSCKTISTPCW